MSGKTSIILIWANTGSGALFDLRHTLRSIDRCWMGRHEVTVVGDAPPGFRINWQNWEKEATPHYPKALDGLRKMWHVLQYPPHLLSDRFVWHFDDQMYMRPVDVEYMAARVALREMHAHDSYSSRVHHQLKLRTWKALREAGLQRIWDFEQHIPPVFERRKMLQLYERFKPAENRLLLKTLYFNWFWPNDPPPLVSRLDDRMVHFNGWSSKHHEVPRPDLHMDEAAQRLHYAKAVVNKHLLCYQDRGRHPMLIELIKTLHPNPSRYELVPVPKPELTIIR